MSGVEVLVGDFNVSIIRARFVPRWGSGIAMFLSLYHP